MSNSKKLSRSITALALAAVLALTGCDTADDPDTPAPSDTTTTLAP